MKNGLDRHDERSSNVVSLANARKRSAKGTSSVASGVGGSKLTAGQWVISALLVVLALGGVLALAAPLLRAVGILGG
jgi:hypothetical protein